MIIGNGLLWVKRVKKGKAKNIISDSFNRQDNYNSLGNTDTGQTWQSAKWGISGSKAYQTSGYETDLAKINTNSGNGDLTVKIQYASGKYPFIFFRGNSSGTNHIMCQLCVSWEVISCAFSGMTVRGFLWANMYLIS